MRILIKVIKFHNNNSYNLNITRYVSPDCILSNSLNFLNYQVLIG